MKWKQKAGKVICGAMAVLTLCSAMPSAAAFGGMAEAIPEVSVTEGLASDGSSVMLVTRDGVTAQEGQWTRWQSFEDPGAPGNGELYHQLNPRQKAVYAALDKLTLEDVLEGGVLQYQEMLLHRVILAVDGVTGLTLEGVLKDRVFTPAESALPAVNALYTDMMAAIVALRYDRPEKIWLDSMRYGYSVEQTDSGSATVVTRAMFDFYLEEGDDTVRIYRETMNRARNLANQASSRKDTYSKVKYVYDRLGAMNTYGTGAQRLSHQAYSALVNGDDIDPVCDGYSKAFKMVMDQLDIPCVLVSGDDHMWNNIKMDDGEWYNLDLTFEDSQSDRTGRQGTTYFLVGRDTLIGEVSFSANSKHVEINPYENYRERNPNRLNEVNFLFPGKSRKAYEYIGKDYEPLRFPDVVRSSWYYSAVEELSEARLFVGYENGFFRPKNNITRAQFALVLSSALGADTAAAPRADFSDVPQGMWYTDAANWAAAEGYMVGYHGRFRPNDNITRQEMCVVLDQVLTRQGRKAPTDDNAFRDETVISLWARDAVDHCRAWGLVSGDSTGRFNPGSPTQRSAAAVVFSKFTKLMRQGPAPEEIPADQAEEPAAP